MEFPPIGTAVHYVEQGSEGNGSDRIQRGTYAAIITGHPAEGERIAVSVFVPGRDGALARHASEAATAARIGGAYWEPIDQTRPRSDEATRG